MDERRIEVAKNLLTALVNRIDTSQQNTLDALFKFVKQYAQSPEIETAILDHSAALKEGQGPLYRVVAHFGAGKDQRILDWWQALPTQTPDDCLRFMRWTQGMLCNKNLSQPLWEQCMDRACTIGHSSSALGFVDDEHWQAIKQGPQFKATSPERQGAHALMTATLQYRKGQLSDALVTLADQHWSKAQASIGLCLMRDMIGTLTPEQRTQWASLMQTLLKKGAESPEGTESPALLFIPAFQQQIRHMRYRPSQDDTQWLSQLKLLFTMMDPTFKQKTMWFEMRFTSDLLLGPPQGEEKDIMTHFKAKAENVPWVTAELLKCLYLRPDTKRAGVRAWFARFRPWFGAQEAMEIEIWLGDRSDPDWLHAWVQVAREKKISDLLTFYQAHSTHIDEDFPAIRMGYFYRLLTQRVDQQAVKALLSTVVDAHEAALIRFFKQDPIALTQSVSELEAPPEKLRTLALGDQWLDPEHLASMSFTALEALCQHHHRMAKTMQPASPQMQCDLATVHLQLLAFFYQKQPSPSSKVEGLLLAQWGMWLKKDHAQRQQTSMPWALGAQLMQWGCDVRHRKFHPLQWGQHLRPTMHGMLSAWRNADQPINNEVLSMVAHWCVLWEQTLAAEALAVKLNQYPDLFSIATMASTVFSRHGEYAEAEKMLTALMPLMKDLNATNEKEIIADFAAACLPCMQHHLLENQAKSVAALADHSSMMQWIERHAQNSSLKMTLVSAHRTMLARKKASANPEVKVGYLGWLGRGIVKTHRIDSFSSLFALVRTLLESDHSDLCRTDHQVTVGKKAPKFADKVVDKLRAWLPMARHLGFCAPLYALDQYLKDFFNPSEGAPKGGNLFNQRDLKAWPQHSSDMRALNAQWTERLDCFQAMAECATLATPNQGGTR